MCRNIKTLFNFEPPVTPLEVQAASLQFVRKITGFNKPSQANEALIQHSESDGISALRLEQRPIVLILSRRQFEIPLDQLTDISSKRHET